MTLPDFSSKKHKKIGGGRWPSGFRPLGVPDMISEKRSARGFEPSVKQALSEFPHLPKFGTDEESSLSPSPMMDEISLDEDFPPLGADLPMEESALEDLPQDKDALDPLSAAEEIFSEVGDAPLPGGNDIPDMDNAQAPKAVAGAIPEDALQRVIDRIDSAVHGALEPLKFEFNQSVLAGFQSILRKSIEEDGKKRIATFIETIVPTSSDLVATLKGPAGLISDLQAQLEAREDLPVKLKFVEDDGLLDIVVTYDTSSVSTRLAEFEAMIAELG
ncbi:hypothetical protein [Ahrensia marina]|uniref:Uncharacterized protein n=1 Tax=Ahrensia marina TaxID=1514904 RepID=A0A0N0E6K8_9HYPH|nr:hypothetical protein [Ahrensia marina]KPB00135.1 hypothetical protein SU32_15615 [Ahrensia marina]